MDNRVEIATIEHDWEWWGRFLQREYYASSDEKKTWRRTVRRLLEQTDLEDGARVLDLGSGSGELAFGLAQHGFRVTGVELHDALVAECREIAEERGLACEFIASDMFSFETSGSFDLIVSINTSFGYGSDQQNRELIASALDWLAPGGRLYLDTVVADEAEGFGLWQDELAGGTLHVDNVWDDEESTMISSPWWVAPNGEIHTAETPERVRIYSIEEIETMLRDAGFLHFKRLVRGSGRRTRNESGPNSTATWVATRDATS